jgi:hypothetical protein
MADGSRMARGVGVWACTLALGALPMVGCGGGQAAPSNCLLVQPCGGDVVGTWSFIETCADVASENGLSSCALLSDVSDTLTGLLTFNADGTFTAANWHEPFARTVTTPLTCSGASSCTAGNGTTTESSNGVTVTQTADCTGTSTCVCHVTGTLDITTTSGSYSAGSASLSLSSSPFTWGFSYCVEGNRLHLTRTVNVISTNPPSDRNIILSDIVAQRQ